MGKPVIAIVGRPNVGKSSFFNYVTGKRISIVEDTPGVTRDRIYEDIEWRGRIISLVDTGGLEPASQDTILVQMRRQAELALDLADVIIFMVDVKDGVTADDRDIATMLRKTKKPVVLAVNKVDNVGDPPPAVYEFYNLGIGDFVTLSSAHGLGIGDVLDAAFEYLPDEIEEVDESDIIKVAIIGRPNAGKSSLINKLLGEERVIVSDIAGTTRDAIDTYTEIDGQKYCFIDTAGMRKRGKITDNIERYSTMRSLTAIDRCDVVVMMVDAVEGVTEQDTKIAGYAHDQGKACVIAINKWDLVEKDTGTLEKYRTNVYESFNFMMYAPVVFISAKSGQRVNKLLENIKFAADQAALRVSTGMLNDVLNEAVAIVQPPSDKGRRLKIFYMTQIKVKPPTFVIFCNSAKLFHYSYLRYIENQIRKNFGFEGTPIVFKIHEKNDETMKTKK
ncbi:MAG: ribosome biogenesis GTPase Der [Ruminococcaceae bacterium]|nr:ribosome biogenesis GTPase Der [Oscillospiraceae bacterium]